MTVALCLALSPITAPPALGAGCETSAPLAHEAGLPVAERALLAVARRLPLEVKAGQLLMVGFAGNTPDAGLLERARRGRIGGFFLLRRNVRDTAQVQLLTSALSAGAAEASDGIRPFVATDFEGGTANALRAITGNTPPAAASAAAGVAGVDLRGVEDATTLRWLGFNLDLAPVADVLSAPSAVIGTRAFSSDASRAAALSRAYLRGLQRGGVLGVLKHFPGHGATAWQATRSCRSLTRRSRRCDSRKSSAVDR
ncbi:MAG: glycoside hydrolase family 3 protein [Chloroflexi bacterium]|nr:glycoside hydrolase family 3 protein [Chloroflexota bacterium]